MTFDPSDKLIGYAASYFASLKEGKAPPIDPFTAGLIEDAIRYKAGLTNGAAPVPEQQPERPLPEEEAVRATLMKAGISRPGHVLIGAFLVLLRHHDAVVPPGLIKAELKLRENNNGSVGRALEKLVKYKLAVKLGLGRYQLAK